MLASSPPTPPSLPGKPYRSCPTLLLLCVGWWFLGTMALAPQVAWGHQPSTRPAPQKKTTPSSKPSSTTSASKRLHVLIRTLWQKHMQRYPLFASAVGDLRYNDKLPDMSLDGFKRRAQQDQNWIKALEQIPAAQLNQTDQVNRALLLRWLGDRLQEYRFSYHFVPITNRYGFHISFPGQWRQLPFQTRKHYEDYIARLRAFRGYAQQHITLLKLGLKTGRTLPQVVMKGYEKTILPHIVDKPEKSLMYRPFRKMATGLSKAEKQQLRSAAKKAIQTSVVPAYRAFAAFMTKAYIPAARKTIGVSAFPQGKALYTHFVQHFVTLKVTPKQVHQTGLREVKRIRKEMEQVIRKVKFKGSFPDFLKHLRTHPKFYAKTPKQLLQEVSYVLKRMDGQLPRLFGKLPRNPYGIREIPAYIAPRTTTAYYMPGSGDGKRAGFYYVNTYNLKSRPLYEVQALSFHEAVPGHHLQIALQQEIQGLPPFRRYIRSMAYQEGWALYAERLGLEVGFYRDPYNNFGRLTYEMWRACRLVVDTGIHIMGWSRKRAIQYMSKHTALSLHNITAEVDRYISWPGQALAYKMGELKIRELRAYATKQLGKKFDLRRFHDEVLRHGALPLDVLHTLVVQYVKQAKAKNNRQPTQPRKK